MEVWKNIPNFNGDYQISNLGNVKSFKRYKEGRLLKPKMKNSGYYFVGLYVNKKEFYMHIHKLVANAFVKNTLNKPHINHINGIKTDNRACNLEYVTQSENMQHAMKNGLLSNHKPILLVNKETKEEKYFYSMSEASRYMGRQFSYIQTRIREANTYENDKYKWEHYDKNIQYAKQEGVVCL